MKTFNATGTCRPDEHYMVDITERLTIIRKMIAKGNCFFSISHLPSGMFSGSDD